MIEQVEFVCGSCEAPNRLRTLNLLRLERSPRCGRCGEALLRALDVSLESLDPDAYQHPLDREALERLQRVPGIRTLLKRVIKHTVELNLRLSQAANTVQVSEQQLPEVHARFQAAAARLGVNPVPELYVVQNPYPNAQTFGVDKYCVTVTTGALELCDEEEQIAIFAHELGHIHSDHMLYKTAARLVSALATQLAQMTFGLGGLVAMPLKLALMWWDRCSELTADRAAMLAVRKPEIVVRLLMKMAGGSPSLYPQMSFEAFLRQADQLERLSARSTWARTLVAAQELFRSHPFPVYRASELVSWLCSGNFLEILDGCYPKRSDASARPCPACGQTIPARALLCPACGADPSGAPEETEASAEEAGWPDPESVVAEAANAASQAFKGAQAAMRSALDEASDWWRRNLESRGAEPDEHDTSTGSAPKDPGDK